MSEAYAFDCLKCKQTTSVDYPVCLKCLDKMTDSNSIGEVSNQLTRYHDSSCHSKDMYDEIQKESRGKSNEGLSNPGPSSIHENFKMPTVSGQKEQPKNEAIVCCRMCKRDIDNHYLSPNKKGTNECCACSYECQEKSQFKAHLSIHYYSYPYCVICKEWIWEREAHFREQNCKVCQQKFQCRTQLENHSLKYENLGHYTIFCRLCNIPVVYHIFEENEGKMYKCCECEFEVFKIHDLLLHLVDHTNLHLFKCDICYRRYKFKKSLRDHSCNLKCRKCDIQFKTLGFLSAHYTDVHKEFACVDLMRPLVAR